MPPMFLRTTALCSLLALAGCSAGMGAASPAPSSNPVAQLLASDRAVFGYFPRSPTPEQAESLAGNRDIDFIMLSQEDELDVPALQAYVRAMNDASARAGVAPIPIFLRMPQVEDAASARQRAQQVAQAGVRGIVFPHTSRAEQAEISVEAMGSELWRRGASGGDMVNVQIVEEPEGIANVRDIMDTPGLSVVFAGPGTLRQNYQGDMVAVEKAIQTVLSACKEFDVPCGVTAGPNDIEQRLREGFEVIIVYDLAALPVGRRAAGRTD